MSFLAVTGPPSSAAPASLLDRVGRIVSRDLAPLVQRIDREGHYPETVLRQLGEAGAFAAHVEAGRSAGAGMVDAISAMARVGQECLATAFCMWCQDALAWYVANSENDQLRRAVLPGAANGRILGGTGL